MESELDYTATKPAKQLTCGECPFSRGIERNVRGEGIVQEVVFCRLGRVQALACAKCGFTRLYFEEIAAWTSEVLAMPVWSLTGEPLDYIRR